MRRLGHTQHISFIIRRQSSSMQNLILIFFILFVVGLFTTSILHQFFMELTNGKKLIASFFF